MAGLRVGLPGTIVQIALFDIVFSLDSVITAVGMARQLPVMIAAVTVALLLMILAAGAISHFVNRYPTINMLALAFPDHDWGNASSRRTRSAYRAGLYLFRDGIFHGGRNAQPPAPPRLGSDPNLKPPARHWPELDPAWTSLFHPSLEKHADKRPRPRLNGPPGV